MENPTKAAAESPKAPAAADDDLLYTCSSVSADVTAAVAAGACDAGGAARAVSRATGASTDADDAPAKRQGVIAAPVARSAVRWSASDAAGADAGQRAAANELLPVSFESSAADSRTRTAGDVLATTQQWGNEGMQQQRQRSQRLPQKKESQQRPWQHRRRVGQAVHEEKLREQHQKTRENGREGLHQLLQDDDERGARRYTSRQSLLLSSLPLPSRPWSAWWRWSSSSSHNKQQAAAAAAADCAVGRGDTTDTGSCTGTDTWWADKSEHGGEAASSVERYAAHAERRPSPFGATAGADVSCGSKSLPFRCGPRLRTDTAATATRAWQIAAARPAGAHAAAAAIAAREQRATGRAGTTGLQRPKFAATSLSSSSRKVEMAAQGAAAAVEDTAAETVELETAGTAASLTAGAAAELLTLAAASAAAAAASRRREAFNGCNRNIFKRLALPFSFSVEAGEAAVAARLLQQVGRAQRTQEGAAADGDAATGADDGVTPEEETAEAAEFGGAEEAYKASAGSGRTTEETARGRAGEAAAPWAGGEADTARSTTKATTASFSVADEWRGCSNLWTHQAGTGGRRSNNCSSARGNSSRKEGSSREDDSGWQNTSRSKMSCSRRRRVTTSSRRRARGRRLEQTNSRMNRQDVRDGWSSAGSSRCWWRREKNSSRSGDNSRLLRNSHSETRSRRQSGSTEDSSRSPSLRTCGSSSSEGQPGVGRLFLARGLNSSTVKGSCAQESVSSHASDDGSGTIAGFTGSKAASVSLPCSRPTDWSVTQRRASNSGSACCEYLQSVATSSGCIGMEVKHRKRGSSSSLEDWWRSPFAFPAEQERDWHIGSCEMLHQPRLRSQQQPLRPRGCALQLQLRQQEKQVRQPQQLGLSEKKCRCSSLLLLDKQQPQPQPCDADGFVTLMRPCCTFATAADINREAAVSEEENAAGGATASLAGGAGAAQTRVLGAGGSAADDAAGNSAVAEEDRAPEQRQPQQQPQRQGKLESQQNTPGGLPAAAAAKKKQDVRQKTGFLQFLLPQSCGGKEELQQQRDTRTAGGYLVGMLRRCYLSPKLLPLRLWHCVHASSAAAAKEQPALWLSEKLTAAACEQSATGAMLPHEELPQVTADEKAYRQTIRFPARREHSAVTTAGAAPAVATSGAAAAPRAATVTSPAFAVAEKSINAEAQPSLADSTSTATIKAAAAAPPNQTSSAMHWPPSGGNKMIECDTICSERPCCEAAEAAIAEERAGEDGWWTAAEEEELGSEPRPCDMREWKQDDKYCKQQQQVLAQGQTEQTDVQQRQLQCPQQQPKVEKDEEKRQKQPIVGEQQWSVLDVFSCILHRRSGSAAATQADECCDNSRSSSSGNIEQHLPSGGSGLAGTVPFVCLPQQRSSYWEKFETSACERAARLPNNSSCRDGGVENGETDGVMTAATKGEAAAAAEAPVDSAPGKETKPAEQRGIHRIMTWKYRKQGDFVKNGSSCCEKAEIAKGIDPSHADLVCCSSAAPAADAAADRCAWDRPTEAPGRVAAAAAALSERATAAPSPAAGSAPAAAQLLAAASEIKAAAGGEHQARFHTDTALPAVETSPGATHEESLGVRRGETGGAVRLTRQRALAAWSRSGVTRGSAAAAVLSLLYLLLQMPCSLKTAMGWMVLLISCFTLGVRLVRLVQQHGLVVLLPARLLRLLEEDRLMDIIYVHLASGRISFYLSRLLLLLFAHPSREEALSLLEGWHPVVVKLLTGRGIREALPQQLLRSLYGQAGAAACPPWDDEAAILQRAARLAATPADLHYDRRCAAAMQAAGSAHAKEEASSAAAAAGLQRLSPDAPRASAAAVEASFAVAAADGVPGAVAEQEVHPDPAERSAASAVVPHASVAEHPSSSSYEGTDETGRLQLAENMHLLQESLTAGLPTGSYAAVAPARRRQGKPISHAVSAACKPSAGRMRQELLVDTESEVKAAACSTETATTSAESGLAAEQLPSVERLHAEEQLQEVHRITRPMQRQQEMVELSSTAQHLQRLPLRRQQKQGPLCAASAYGCELLPFHGSQQSQPRPAGTPAGKQDNVSHAFRTDQKLPHDSELSPALRAIRALPRTATPDPTPPVVASPCAPAAGSTTIPRPSFSFFFQLPRCFSRQEGEPSLPAPATGQEAFVASPRQRALAGAVAATVVGAAALAAPSRPATAATDVCASGEGAAAGTASARGRGAASAAAAGWLAAGENSGDLNDRTSINTPCLDTDDTAVSLPPPPCSSAATTQEFLPASWRAACDSLGEDMQPWRGSSACARLQSPPVLYEPSRLSEAHLQASKEICELPVRVGPQPTLFPPTAPVVLRMLVSRLTTSRTVAGSIERFKEKLLHLSLFAAFCAALLRHPRVRRVIHRIPVSVIFWLALAFYLYLISPSRSPSSVRRLLSSAGGSYPVAYFKCLSAATPSSSTGLTARPFLLPLLPAWLIRLLRLRKDHKRHSGEVTAAGPHRVQVLQKPREVPLEQQDGIPLQQQQQVSPLLQLHAQGERQGYLTQWQQPQQQVERLLPQQLLRPPLQQQQQHPELVAVGEAVEERVASSSSDWQDDGLLQEAPRLSSGREQRRGIHILGNEDPHLRVCKEALQCFLRQHFWPPFSHGARSRP